MATKNNPGIYDCYSKAEPDEPTFTLLARDADAPEVVEFWARCRAEAIMCGTKPKEDYQQVNEARQCASAMRAWRFKKRHRNDQENKTNG